MKNIISLIDLKIDDTAKISHIDCEEHIKRRFFDLGIISGTPITPVFKSISGDPIAYEVRNFLLAIRLQDAKNIFVYNSNIS